MAKQFTVKARFEATDRATPKIEKVEGRFKRLTKTIKASSLAQVAAIGGVAVAFRGMVRFMGDSIRKANEQEIAVNRLNAALSSLGSGAASVSKSLQAQASALQKVTTFGDEAIISVQTLIASFVKDENAIKQSTAATLDFASAFGIELNAAAALVAKSLGSSTNALTRYGIEVEGAVGSTERLESLISNVAKVAGGRAAADVDTFSGAIDQLGNNFGDAQEKIAAFITQSKILNSVIREMSSLMGMVPFLIDTFAPPEPIGNEFLDDLGKLRKELGLSQVEAMAMAGNFNTLQNMGMSAAEAIDTIRRNTLRGRTANQEYIESTDRLHAKMKEMGVSLDSELNAKIEANIILIDTANQKFRETGETGYLETIQSLTAENALFGATLGETATATDDLTGRTDTLTGSLSAEERQLQATAAATGQLTQATYELSRAKQQANAQALIHAAAGEGGRIHLLREHGGGSRLIGDSSGRGGSFTPAQAQAYVSSGGRIVPPWLL